MNHLLLTAPLALRERSPSTLPSHFEGIAYSGGLVASFGVVIDLSSTKVKSPMHLLYEHGRDKIVGIVDAAANDGRNLIVGGKLFSDLPGGEAERIARLAQRGSPWQLSVGLFGFDETPIGRGQVAQVNGRALEGPFVLLTGGQVREVSVVAIGADVGADARVFSTGGRRVPSPQEVYARRRLEAKGSRR